MKVVALATPSPLPPDPLESMRYAVKGSKIYDSKRVTAKI